MKFKDFPGIYLDAKSSVVRQLERQLVYTSLLVIITLHFTCGERKISSISFSTIKKSQNIMSMIVRTRFFTKLIYISGSLEKNS